MSLFTTTKVGLASDSILTPMTNFAAPAWLSTTCCGSKYLVNAALVALVTTLWIARERHGLMPMGRTVVMVMVLYSGTVAVVNQTLYHQGGSWPLR